MDDPLPEAYSAARKKAITGAYSLVNERLGIDLRDRLKVSPAELVQGGYPKLQKVVGRLVAEKVALNFREEVDPEVVRWVDAATSAPIGLVVASPGASSWVRSLPTSPECTLSDCEFNLALRSRFLLPIAVAGSLCTYCPSSSLRVCRQPLDPYVCHAHRCARKQVSSRHNAIGLVLRDMAREAGHQAHVDQLAVELPPAEIDGPRLTRVSDVRVSGCRGEAPVFLDVVVTSTRQCDHGAWATREAGAGVRIQELSKIRSWGEASAPSPAQRGRFIPIAI